MKKLIFVLGLGLIIGMVNINNIDAQIHVSINIDIQPAWGPSGYNYAEYYYLPEIDVYYNVIDQRFYYYNRGRWISSPFLPMAYSHYDFYSLYKVVLNGVHNPWNYNKRHTSLYAEYRYNYVQVPIYYMNDSRYNRAKNNYHGWVEPRYMPQNNGRPNSRDYSMNTRNGKINDTRSMTNSKNNTATHNNRSKANVNNKPQNNYKETPVANNRNDSKSSSVSSRSNNSVNNNTNNNTGRTSSVSNNTSTTSRSTQTSGRTSSSRSGGR